MLSFSLQSSKSSLPTSSLTLPVVQDVDAVNMGDGCFSAYGGTGIRFVNARCRDNHCGGWLGKGKQTSNSKKEENISEKAFSCS